MFTNVLVFQDGQRVAFASKLYNLTFLVVVFYSKEGNKFKRLSRETEAAGLLQPALFHMII